MPTESTFESRTASLSEHGDSETHIISGIAIGDNDVSNGLNGRKIWPAEEIQAAASTLQGSKIKALHSDAVVGEVTKASYEAGEGVVYEAELTDDKLAEGVEEGRLTVSLEAIHDYDGTVETDSHSALIVSDITFDGLALVQRGAAPSATAEPGQAAALSLLSSDVRASVAEKVDSPSPTAIGTTDAQQPRARLADSLQSASDEEVERALSSPGLSEIQDEELQSSIEYLQDVDADVADRFTDEAEDRADAAARAVELKLLLQQAKEAGLEDDPAVEALQKRAQMLLVDNGLTPDPTAGAQLAEEYGADESMLEDLSDDDCETLLEHLSMAEEIGDNDGLLAKKEIRRRFEETEALLAQNNVEVRHLFQPEARGLEGELSAALSRGAEFGDNDVAVDASSDRVRKAQLQDNLSEIDDRLESADHPFMKHSLREERSAVEARLSALDVGESDDSTDSDHPFSR